MVSYDCIMLAMEQLSTHLGTKDSITQALIDIVDRHGLDGVSVREVAVHAKVSIGTVQHHFPTKDAMLSSAYEEVVRRLRNRLEAVPLGDDARRNIRAVLTELLPLDRQRRTETRVHLAFAASAATSPALAETQRKHLAEIHAGLVQALAAAWGPEADSDTARVAAHAAIALVDGIALHAVSSRRWISQRRQVETLDLGIDVILAAPRIGG